MTEQTKKIKVPDGMLKAALKHLDYAHDHSGIIRACNPSYFAGRPALAAGERAGADAGAMTSGYCRWRLLADTMRYGTSIGVEWIRRMYDARRSRELSNASIVLSLVVLSLEESQTESLCLILLRETIGACIVERKWILSQNLNRRKFSLPSPVIIMSVCLPMGAHRKWD